MTVPADGVSRLMNFIEARMAQLKISKGEAAGRGLPAPNALSKVHGRDILRILQRIDNGLGWQAGSAAAVLLGGYPRTVTAHRTGGWPVTGQEVVSRLLGQLGEQISALKHELADLEGRLRQLEGLHEALVDVFREEPLPEPEADGSLRYDLGS